MLSLSFECPVTVTLLLLFLTVPRVCLQFVIVVFPGHTHLLFGYVLRFMIYCFYEVFVYRAY